VRSKPAGTTTHVFTAYLEHTTCQLVEVNTAMLAPAGYDRHVARAMPRTWWSTGGRQSPRPFKTPRGDDPRHAANMYYQRTCSRRASAAAWRWSASRPHAVSGFSVGPDEPDARIAVYAAICGLGLLAELPVAGRYQRVKCDCSCSRAMYDGYRPNAEPGLQHRPTAICCAGSTCFRSSRFLGMGWPPRHQPGHDDGRSCVEASWPGTVAALPVGRLPAAAWRLRIRRITTSSRTGRPRAGLRSVDPCMFLELLAFRAGSIIPRLTSHRDHDRPPPGSPHRGHKITIFLEETGLPYTIVPVNIGRGEQFQPEFL
jgi:hypothetical protein